MVHLREVSRHVFAEYVELDIHHRTGLDILEIGVLLGVGDNTNGDIAFVAFDVGFADGEADAVDGDRTFVHAEIAALHHLAGAVVLEPVVPTAVCFMGVDTRCFLVNVAL